MKKIATLTLGVLVACGTLAAQTPQTPLGPPPERDPLTPAPARRSGEGAGPFKTLVIRGAILVDGSGAPPTGPVDIIIENNRIQSIRSAGTPGLPLRANRQPDKPDHEIDASGMYVLPGFVSLHEH